MTELNNRKSIITYENKIVFGVIGIIIGLIVGMTRHGIFEESLILICPCILLVIPIPTIRNSKILAAITIIILSIFIIRLIFDYQRLGEPYTGMYMDLIQRAAAYTQFTRFLEIIIGIYGIFCGFLLAIQTEPNQTKNVFLSIKNNMYNNNAKKFDKYCSECGCGLMNDAKFCPNCGHDLNSTVDESTVKENEKDELKCKYCGTELNEEHIFCPQCGEKIKDETE